MDCLVLYLLKDLKVTGGNVRCGTRKEKKWRNDRKYSVGGYKEKGKRKRETIENLVWMGRKRKEKEMENL